MLLKNERGSSLVMVLLVLTVGSMIGLAMLTIGVNEDLQVSAEEKNIQAYYIARSAVDAVAAYIIEEKIKDAEDNTYTFDSSDFEDLVNDHAEPVEFADGEAVVTLTSVGDTIEIEATSTYAKKFTGHATLVLDERLYFNHIIWANDPLENPPVDVYGVDLEIASNGDIDNSPDKIRGDPSTLLDNQNEGYPDPEYPNPWGPVFPGDQDIQNSDPPYTISVQQIEFDQFEVSSNILTFDTDAAGGNIYMKVNDASFSSGSIILITGAHRVEIFVEDSMNLQTPIDVGNDPEKLTFNLMPLSDGEDEDDITQMNITANGSVYAYIKGPSAKVNMGSSQTDFFGAITCKEFTSNGYPDITYVPPSDDYNEEEHLLERRIWKD